MPTSWSQNGVPALVSGDGNAAALSTAIDDRLMGMPRTTPSTTLVGAVITAWRNIANPAASLIDCVNRKVTSTDDATKITAFGTAASGGAAYAVLTAADPTQPASLWTVDYVSNLDAILGGDKGKGLFYGSIQDKSLSLESLLNLVVNKLGALNKKPLIAIDQDAGTVKIGLYTDEADATTAANTARSSAPSSPAVFVTHEVPEASVSSPTAGPNFGL